MPNVTSLIISSIALVFLTGCGGITVRNMVPVDKHLSATRLGASIAVNQVSGAQKEIFGGPEMVQNDEFKAALIETLRDSKLFDRVSADGGCEYGVTAEMVAQGQGSGINYRSVLVVDYIVTRSDTGRQVWRKSFNSSHTVTLSEEWSGAARTVKAQEGSVRDNLRQFIEALSAVDLK